MFIYGVTTVGATVHLHFCMDKFVGWDLSHSQNSTCSKCGMKESATKKGCCKDEEKQLKIDTDHQKSTITSFENSLQAPVINNFPIVYQFTRVDFKASSKDIFYPPPLDLTIQKRIVMYCTYRI